MNVRELRYLEELVMRDGDRKLQAKHGIFHREEVAAMLRDIANTADKGEFATHFAVFKDAEIGWRP